MITAAKVATPHGAAYTSRLRKHFAHKMAAVANGDHGRIEFPVGLCTIHCHDEFMQIRVQLSNTGEVDRAECVVGGNASPFD